MTTLGYVIMGALPVIAFALGAIVGWLKYIHKVLLEIRVQLEISNQIRSVVRVEDIR